MQYAKETLSVFLKYKDSSTYSINNMEPTKEVISSLKFIGQLQKGDKINTKFMYRQPDGLMTRISRTLINHDNRHNALAFVQRTISCAFEVITSYLRSEKNSDITLCMNVVNDLKQAKIGLLHLKDTYSEDLKFRCDMETLLEDIDAKLGELKLTTPKLSSAIGCIPSPLRNGEIGYSHSPTLSTELGDLND